MALAVKILFAEAVLGSCVPLLGCLAEPVHSFGVIRCHSSTAMVQQANYELGIRQSLLGGLEVPCHRLVVVLGHTATVPVHVAMSVLRVLCPSIAFAIVVAKF